MAADWLPRVGVRVLAAKRVSAAGRASTQIAFHVRSPICLAVCVEADRHRLEGGRLAAWLAPVGALDVRRRPLDCGRFHLGP